MTMISTMMVLCTKGEPVKAETVGGWPTEVVEFFDPDAFEAPADRYEGDAITLDLPKDTWEQMGSPTEITVSIAPGNLIEDNNL